MAGPVNPTKLNWQHGGKNTDGSDIQTVDFKAWELELNGVSVMNVPIGWNVNGVYEAPISMLNLPQGPYSARLRLVSKTASSAWSNVTEFEIQKIPTAPFNLSSKV